uniref:Uncharacterized protein n=1 Tax=Rhizophora mucronata TaxID=61149 RepID=A0A2P2MDD0_RHIMU
MEWPFGLLKFSPLYLLENLFWGFDFLGALKSWD